MPPGTPAVLGEVGISVDFGFFKLDTKWVEDPRQRDAAWALYVELATRIATQGLDLDVGLLREALESLHALFAVTRGVLRTGGPAVGSSSQSVGGIALIVLNKAVRPFLAKWHPALAHWEAQSKQSATTSQRDHERAWPEELKCRAELAKLQEGLLQYAQALARIASPGVA